ncbi:hypothetical protein KRMM14A1259_72130 [Krasilnikovia sp. MM14-A1259]
MTLPWLPISRSVVQPIAGALSAVVLVVFAGLLGLLALGCGEGRRLYALDYADKFIDLAGRLVGARPTARTARRRDARPCDR